MFQIRFDAPKGQVFPAVHARSTRIAAARVGLMALMSVSRRPQVSASLVEWFGKGATSDPILLQNIYHELTHKIIGTNDHFYGPALCRTRAVGGNIHCRRNADSFGYFVTSLDGHVWQVHGEVLHCGRHRGAGAAHHDHGPRRNRRLTWSRGAGYPSRTDDLPLTRRVLYQLS